MYTFISCFLFKENIQLIIYWIYVCIKIRFYFMQFQFVRKRLDQTNFDICFRRQFNFPGWTKGCEHDDQVPAPGPGWEGGVAGGGAGGAPGLWLRLWARGGGGLRHPVHVQPRHLWVRVHRAHLGARAWDLPSEIRWQLAVITKTLNLLHTLLHKATIGMRELVRAETDTRLALYDHVRDIHINVPQIIFNIVSRLHQYSPNISTIVNIRILYSICW